MGFIDFGKEWYGIPFSKSWDAMSERGVSRSLVFIDEVKRACMADKDVPRRFAEHFLESNGELQFSVEAMYYVLPLRWGTCSFPAIPMDELPQRLVRIDLEPGSDDTVELFLDNGWQFKIVLQEGADLKFQVDLISVPLSVFEQ